MESGSLVSGTTFGSSQPRREARRVSAEKFHEDAHTALAPPVPPSPPRLLESSPAGRLRREEASVCGGRSDAV